MSEDKKPGEGKAYRVGPEYKGRTTVVLKGEGSAKALEELARETPSTAGRWLVDLPDEAKSA